MTNNPTRISIPIGTDELEALRLVAQQNYRDTRDQARYLLRIALGLNRDEYDQPVKSNVAGQVLADPGDAVKPN